MKHYSLSQLQKTVVAGVVAVAALVALFIQFDPSLTQAVIAVVIAAFNVLAVFQANSSPVDIGKTIQALIASGLALIGFFHTFNPNESETILAAAAALVNVVGVYSVRNKD